MHSHRDFLLRLGLLLTLVLWLAQKTTLYAEFWMVAIGQAHIWLAFLYSARAGKFSIKRFVIAMLSVGALYVLFSYWPNMDALRSLSAVWFGLHLVFDERYLRKSAPDVGFTATVLTFPFTIAGATVATFYGPRIGGVPYLVALILAFYAITTTWSDAKARRETLEMVAPTLISVPMLWSGLIQFPIWLAIFIIYHYMHWYRATASAALRPPERRWVYIRDVVLFNVVSIGATYLWQLRGVGGYVSALLFSTNMFFIWSIGHFIYTARLPDATYFKISGRIPSQLSRYFIYGSLVGAIGALGYAGPGILPFYLFSIGALAWMAMHQNETSHVIAFGIGFSLAQFAPAFMGAMAWGWLLVLAIMFCMSLSITLPMIAIGRLVRRLNPSTIALLLITFSGGALAQLIPDFFNWPIATSAHLATWPILITPARWIGMAGLSGCVTMSVFIAARLIGPQPNGARVLRATLAAASVYVLLAGAGWFIRQAKTPSDSTLVTVGVPQINADSVYYRDKLINGPLRVEYERRLSSLLAQLKDVDLLVTPEEFDSVLYPHLPQQQARWQNYAKDLQQNVLLSTGMIRGNGRVNAVMAIDHRGKQIGLHEKVDLAPVGEADRIAGKHYTVFDFGTSLKIGALVCMEAALQNGTLKETQQGATLLATSTSDIAFGSSALVYLHLAMSQIHSAATARDMIWASNGGPSGHIDHYGSYFPAVPFQGSSAARFTVQTHNDLTPYVRWIGNYGALLWFFLGACGIGLAMAWNKAGSRPYVAVETMNIPIDFGIAWALLSFVIVMFAINAIVTIRHPSALGLRASLARFWQEIPPPNIDKQTFAHYVSGADYSLAGATSVFLTDLGLPQDWKSLAQFIEPKDDWSKLSSDLEEHFGIHTRQFNPEELLLKDLRWIGKRRDNLWYVAQRSGDGMINIFQPWDGQSIEFASLPLPPEWNSAQGVTLSDK